MTPAQLKDLQKAMTATKIKASQNDAIKLTTEQQVVADSLLAKKAIIQTHKLPNQTSPLAKFSAASQKLAKHELAPRTGLVTPEAAATSQLDKLRDLMAKQKAEAAAKQVVPNRPIQINAKALEQRAASQVIQDKGLLLPKKKVLAQIPSLAPTVEDKKVGRVEKHEITYELLNEKQREAVNLAKSGESFILIGSAGTGKTTTQRVVLETLAKSDCLRQVPDDFEHKYLPNGIQSVVVMSYMNKAVNNIRSALPYEFKHNAITIHKFLEYSPSTEEVEKITEDGETYYETKKIFLPMRDKENPVLGITHQVIEEASTVDLELWKKKVAADDPMNPPNLILLGDIKQLPPVFGQSILSEKLQTMKIVELTEVYRTAADSPIKKLAIDINEGVPISDKELNDNYAKKGELEFVNFSGKKPNGQIIPRRQAQNLIRPIVNSFKKLIDTGEFQPFRDVILCPFRVNNNDGINCTNLNERLADYHGRQRKAVVFEILCGWEKVYLAVDDPIYLNKKEYRVKAIVPNKKWSGAPARPESVDLDRWGKYHGEEATELDLDGTAEIEALMKIEIGKNGSPEQEEAIKRAASHKIILTAVDSDEELDGKELETSAAGDIRSIEFAYALTVHKAIGSEWERVYLVIHHSHSGMLSRELFYTAVTRAKLFLQIMYDGHDHSSYKTNTSMISKAIISPAIKGVTLEEKLAWLKAEAERKNEVGGATLLAKFAPKQEAN